MQTIQLAGDYDFARADELRSLLQAADPADTLTLDCSKVTYFDSAAIAELVRLRRERNAPFKILASRPVEKLLEIAGLTRLFTVEPVYQASRASNTPAPWTSPELTQP
ncbi:MAG TPA: STAS domain-containing protein [Candidatus Baltobacteraceae bacterium]|nr:STAS domain-containing protein [Candidatus Baltobacteraceae bacterium]